MDYNDCVIRLSLVDKTRILFGNVDASEFVGMLAPHVREEVPPGSSFRIADDPKGRYFRYIIEDGDEYIMSGSVKYPLSKSRSLTGVLMDKITNNQFTHQYQELKNTLSLHFLDQLNQ